MQNKKDRGIGYTIRGEKRGEINEEIMKGVLVVSGGGGLQVAGV